MIGTVKKINIPVESSGGSGKFGNLFITSNESTPESKIKTKEIKFILNKFLSDNKTVMNTEVIYLIKDGRYNEAEIILSDILNENPNDSSAANNLGVIFELEEKFELSMNMYYKAWSIDPQNQFYRKNFLFLLDSNKQ